LMLSLKIWRKLWDFVKLRWLTRTCTLFSKPCLLGVPSMIRNLLTKRTQTDQMPLALFGMDSRIVKAWRLSK
jgi:hypothetical protein